MARLQDELICVKLREVEALTGLKELRQQVRDLEDHWQVSANTSIPHFCCKGKQPHTLEDEYRTPMCSIMGRRLLNQHV